MTRIILVRSGATDFDREGRIKGTLDIPLNQQGNDQAVQAATELTGQRIELIFSSPCQSAQQTARLLADRLGLKVKTLRHLQNLDHGLWQGKRINELRERQKKVYRKWQEQPETVCPPDGEPVGSAQHRVKTELDRIIKKHKHGVVALVLPDPLTTLARSYLEQSQLGGLWECQCACGGWQSIDVEPKQLAKMAANQA